MGHHCVLVVVVLLPVPAVDTIPPTIVDAPNTITRPTNAMKNVRHSNRPIAAPSPVAAMTMVPSAIPPGPVMKATISSMMFWSGSSVAAKAGVATTAKAIKAQVTLVDLITDRLHLLRRNSPENLDRER